MFSINVRALISGSVGFASHQNQLTDQPPFLIHIITVPSPDTMPYVSLPPLWCQMLWCVFNLSHIHKYPLTQLLIGMSIVRFSPSLLWQSTNLRLCSSILSIIQIREYASTDPNTNKILSRFWRELVECAFPLNDPSSSASESQELSNQEEAWAFTWLAKL